MPLATYAAAVERFTDRASAVEEATRGNDPESLWQLIRETLRDFHAASEASETIREEHRRLREIDEFTIAHTYGTEAPDGLELVGQVIARHGTGVFTDDGLSQLAALHMDTYARAHR